MTNQKIKVLISFASYDEYFVRNYLVKHLQSLTDIGLIDLWYYPKENVGTRWEENLKIKFAETDVVLFVLSSSFISSPYCKKELQWSLDLERTKGIKIVPILFSECLWDGLGINPFFTTPKNGKFISDDDYWGRKKDKPYTIVARDVKAVCEALVAERQAKEKRKQQEADRKKKVQQRAKEKRAKEEALKQRKRQEEKERKRKEAERQRAEAANREKEQKALDERRKNRHLEKRQQAIEKIKKQTLEVVISYSRYDGKFLYRLENQLSPLVRTNKINLWYDTSATNSSKWEERLRTKFNQANIILLFISGNYIKSEYTYEVELPLALDLMEQEKVIIIPIYFDICMLEELSIPQEKLVPKKSYILDHSTWRSANEPWAIVAQQVSRVRKAIINQKIEAWEAQQKEEEQNKRKRGQDERTKKYGYRNGHSTFVIPPEYSDARKFSEGFAAVSKSDPSRFGYINDKNRLVIPYQYHDAKEFSEGLAAVSTSTPNRYGYINTNGQLIISQKYHKAYPFKDGIAEVVILVPEIDQDLKIINRERTIYINKKGEQILQNNLLGISNRT